MKKKMLLSLFVVLSLFIIAGCDSSKDSKDKDDDTVISSRSKKNKLSKVNIEETVILDKEDVKVTAKSISYDSRGEINIKLLIENNSDENITLQTRNFTINDLLVDEYLSVDVAAGKKANDVITIFEEDLKKSNIETIKDIEFDMYAFETKSYDDLFEENGIKLTTDAKKYKQSYDVDGELIVDEEDVKIYYLNTKSDKDLGGINVNIFVENNTDKQITITAEDVSVNGFMIDPVFIIDIPAGKKAYDALYFYDDELEKNDIDKIKELELKFVAETSKNYKELFTTDKLTIK